MKRSFSILFALLLTSAAAGQTGHVLNGVGPIDQSMSGAGMAAPQDALTALHWNPASLFAVPGRSLDISLQIMAPSGSLESSVDAEAFAPMFPPQALNGSTDSDPGLFPIPSLGFASVSTDSRFAFGLSAFAVGGFGVDYALSPSNLQIGDFPANPLLSAQQAEGGIGFGALSSTFALFQVSPTVAYQINDVVSVGFAPTLNMASLELSVFPATSPQFFPNPQGATAPPLALYPDAPAAWATGFGFQAGIHANLESGLSAGLSFKSKQAFQDFEYAPTTTGAADYTFRLDYPMIVSGALAFEKDNLLLAGDVRYIDFENTTGFEETGFDQTGAVKGFGWKSVVVIAVGAQYQLTEKLPVRVGYSYNSSPIDDDLSFFNTPAPAIIMSHVSAGASYQLSDRISASLAGQLGLSNSISGAWKTIDGTGQTVSIPGTNVESTLSTVLIIGGVHIAL